MSTSRAIKPKRDDTQLGTWESVPERAPSVERADAPMVPRIVAMVGLFLTVLGTLAMLAPTWQRTAAIPPGWGFTLASIGICFLIYHAFIERDFQFRRLYGFLGLALGLVGIVLKVLAFRAGYASWFVLFGLPALSIGLILMIAVLRNESDEFFRTMLLNFAGGLGLIMIAYAGIFGVRTADYLAGEGAVFLLLGLCYVCTFIGQQPAHSDRAYYAAIGLGAIGALGFVAGLGMSIINSTFLIPGGLIFMSIGILYVAISLGMCVDWPVILIARRELAAYFYSPIAYLVLVGLLLIGWFMFDQFVTGLAQGMIEPIIGAYIFELFSVIVQIFVIPVLTMRLFSEEKRTGTLEVLLTAPVNEVSIVVGKFLAAWIFYMLTWAPMCLFLVALRYMGNEEFDYRPMLSFMVALAATNAGLLAMGLFFSCTTSNQIIAAVLSFVGVILHLAAYFLRHRPNIREGTPLHELLTYVNFLDLWNLSLGGNVAPRYLIFHASVAMFFLFATVKLLESRKWK